MRPQIFDEVAGQSIPQKILKIILKKSEVAPKSLIFEGAMGTGKTTLARIFARALNCLDLKKDGNPCMQCENCKQDLDFSSYYQEYDASIVGNVEQMKMIKETFAYSTGAKWRVIVFDEIHTASQASQSTLLKELEDVKVNNFYIFCTTEIKKIIKTIQSRALILTFDKIVRKDMEEGLIRISSRESNSPPVDIRDLIIKRSGGHMRDAHKLLALYYMVEGDSFKDMVRIADNDFKMLFISLLKSKEDYFSSLQKLLTYPIIDLKNDFQNVLLDITSHIVGAKIGDELTADVAKYYGNNWFNFVKLLMSPWVLDSFYSDITFQTCFLALYQMIKGNKKEDKK